MCLLVALFKQIPGYPLVVAANRDEFLERPAVPMAVLQDTGPRILGGRDELAGGTWLAVNEHGLIAALTNFPSPTRDPARRSRGELPIALASHRDAKTAAAAFAQAYRPADYNPAWILVGDRESLFYIDFTQG
ncbi:MAG: NRDE family protein, partial [Candidatus Sericytochromatia bacterium]|nr:NRDE family protein [Candidatus Tanganyikabacteria bacterium]